MGAWGNEPWENDSASDFLGELFENTPIVDRVHAGLGADDGALVVAALWLCTLLCNTYTWPVDRLDETLAIAVAAADRLLSGQPDDHYLELWDEPVARGQVEGFRSDLESRRRTRRPGEPRHAGPPSQPGVSGSLPSTGHDSADQGQHPHSGLRDGKVADRIIPITKHPQLTALTGSWTFGPANAGGAQFPSALRLGRNANPKFPADAWARIQVPSGTWKLSGMLGISDIPPAPGVVLFLEIVIDPGEVVLWRTSLQPDELLYIPDVHLPVDIGSFDLHAGFESPRALTYLVLVDLRLSPA
jgi:hypothetical protein